MGSGNGRWKELRGDAGCQLGLGSLRRPPTLAGKGSAADVYPSLGAAVDENGRPDRIDQQTFCSKLQKGQSLLMLDGDLSSFVNVTTNGLWSLCARRSLSLWQSSSVHLI